MSDRKTSTFSRNDADEHYADQNPAGQRPGQQSAYAEDPLVELARIVSESAQTSPITGDYAEPAPSRSSMAPQYPAEPQQEYNLPDDFGSDLEAELMAELAPAYTPEPRMPSQPPAPQAPQQAVQQGYPAQSYEVQQAASASQPQARPVVAQPLPRATPQAPDRQVSLSQAELSGQGGYADTQPRFASHAPQVHESAPFEQANPSFDPLAYASPQPDPVDDSARYADAAAEALEAAVQEELRLATYGNERFAAPEEVAPQVAHDPSFDARADAFPVQGHEPVSVPQPQQPQPQQPQAVYPSAQAGALRGGFDEDLAGSYGQQAYPVEPAGYAPQEPAYETAPAYVEPRFDVDDMQWPAEPDHREAGQFDAPRAQEPRYAQPGDDFGLDDIFEAEEDAAPQRVPQGVLPEHPKAEKRAAPRAEPKKRGMLIAAAVAAVVVVGGGVFVVSGLFGSGGPSGPPVRIAAAKGPFKVFPEAREASSEPSPSKAIYDRVAGVQARDEQLVPREEEPISAVPTTADDSGARAVSGNGMAPDMPSRPKRVRTVVVRPDGTIIAAPDLPGTAASAESPQAGEAPALAPTMTSPANNGANIRTVATRQVDSMAEATGNGAQAGASERVPSTPERTQAGGATASDALMPRPKPDAPETRVASAEPASNAPIQRSGPLDLTGGNTAQSAPAAPAQPARTSASIPSGSYVVQVSSQRTQEQAEQAYASMQRRFPSILGNVQAVYPSVDLGDRGTFYRVRIVAGGQAEANDLCSQLKSAGGDCFVRRSE